MASIQVEEAHRSWNIGLLQPFADGAKLFLKEIDTCESNKILFLVAPIIFLARVIAWSIMHCPPMQ